MPGPPMPVEITANAYTFEGHTQRLGALSASIRRAPGWKGWVGRIAVLAVLFPTLVMVAYQAWFLFAG